ncbi:MAG: NADH dehydrogenase I subunit E [candidate division Zixibacteria bacterium RBG-1]|nr:MAG: NADH dehydrogenase I subunit E [candidate division Zixibacteria bacterium RBG-1]
MILSEKTQKKILAEKNKYPQPKTAILPALYAVYEEFGYLSNETMKETGELLNIPFLEIVEVASFYTMFPKKPTGKYFLQVCTNLSCALLGAEDLVKHLEEKLKVKTGQVTPDGVFSIGRVECLGSCGTAPMLQVNNLHFQEDLTKEKVDKLLEELKKS